MQEHDLGKGVHTERGAAGFQQEDGGGLGDPLSSDLGMIRKIHDKKYLEYIDQQQKEIYGTKKKI